MSASGDIHNEVIQHNVIKHNVNLQTLNTLALPAHARYFARIESVETLRTALLCARDNAWPLLILGGGSNVILAGDWPGLVLQIAITGKTIQRVDGGALVTIGAGENWHELVQWTLAQNLFGLENLTLIPGTAGAAPIQNIGAYGVELAERLQCVRGISLDDFSPRELSLAECELAYRDSIFKNALRNRFVITEIVLRLRDVFVPIVNYPTLRDELSALENPTALDVESAVRRIRQSRLPDPATLPNVGSFFKNPVIAREHFQRLQEKYAAIPSFPAKGDAKIPAAWLVEQSGWKGKRRGAVGVHQQQALVLIHYRDADVNVVAKNAAQQLLELAADIQRDVQTQFGITLELEPTVYGKE